MYTIAKIENKTTYKKTLSFTSLHLTVVFLVMWMLTGSPFIGGIAAIIEPVISSVVYFLHEKVWERLSKKSVFEKEA